MAQSEIAAAVRAICEEKGLSVESVVETIEAALAAAYRKDFGEKNQNIKVDFNLDTAESRVFDEKVVVEDVPEEELEESDDEQPAGEKNEEKKGAASGEEKKKKAEGSEGEPAPAPAEEAAADENEEEKHRFNPRTEIQLSDARELGDYKIGDVIRTELPIPAEYGRMAAQTAKQVIIQRLREVERSNIFEEYKDKEGEVITGVVQRREGRVILVDIGKTTAIITPEGQVPGESYAPNSRLKAYVESVGMGPKGPEIILSRTSPEIVKKVFYLEIPEIGNGLIDLHGVSREPGSRSKVAVAALEENVDPIGSCVGQRGARIQTIINELGGEKVDIIEYSEDAEEFISHALAPAKVIKVELDEDERKAVVYVASDQLSLAIGKGGQNVRLAAKLTGWKIDIKEITNEGEEVGVASSDGETVEKEDSGEIQNEEESDDKKDDEEVKEEDGDKNEEEGEVESEEENEERDDEKKEESEKEEDKK